MPRRSPLAALLKLGPTTERWPNAVGVHAARGLLRLGSVNAYRLLKGRGLRCVGSTIIYAHMQAIGMVNDHLIDCFRYQAQRGLK